MNQNQQSIAAPSINLAALRLPANYGATLGVKKMLVTVPVGKPNKAKFFRAHAGETWCFPAMILDQKEDRETYLVLPEVGGVLDGLARPVQLYAAIDRNNNPSLIPVPLPGEDGRRNPWHESLAQAVEHAKKNWVRISANMGLGSYDVHEAQADLPEPDWPDQTLENLIEIGFRGKIIADLDHPVVQALLGRM